MYSVYLYYPHPYLLVFLFYYVQYIGYLCQVASLKRCTANIVVELKHPSIRPSMDGCVGPLILTALIRVLSTLYDICHRCRTSILKLVLMFAEVPSIVYLYILHTIKLFYIRLVFLIVYWTAIISFVPLLNSCENCSYNVDYNSLQILFVRICFVGTW